MATTLLNLRDLLRIELRDPNGITYQDADCDYALNQAYRKTFQRIIQCSQDYFETVAYLDIVANDRYIDLPDDFFRAKSVEIVLSNLEIPLFRRIRAATINATSVGGTLNVNIDSFVYDFEGDRIYLEPTPVVDRDSALKLRYYQTYTELVDDSDEINSNFKDIWIDVLVLEAVMVCISQLEARGGRVSMDGFKDRLNEARDVMSKSLNLRTLSPLELRKKRFFQ